MNDVEDAARYESVSTAMGITVGEKIHDGICVQYSPAYRIVEANVVPEINIALRLPHAATNEDAVFSVQQARAGQPEKQQ